MPTPIEARSTPAPTAPPAGVLGWREWACLPDLGLAWVLAKIDTGARSCALHVDSQRCFHENGVERVEFSLHPTTGSEEIRAVADVLTRRAVTDSGGRVAERVFIRSRLRLGGQEREVDINLVARRRLRHPMLIGRAAIAGHWWVDPSASFLHGNGPERGA